MLKKHKAAHKSAMYQNKELHYFTVKALFTVASPGLCLTEIILQCWLSTQPVQFQDNTMLLRHEGAKRKKKNHFRALNFRGELQQEQDLDYQDHKTHLYDYEKQIANLL